MHADLAVVLEVLDEFLHLAHVEFSTSLKGLAEDKGPQRHPRVVDPQLIVDAAEKHGREADKGPADLCLHDHRPQLLREMLDLLLMFRTHRAERSS
eukprot:COSAG02_NODE_73_length_41919_cov_6.571066_31_plen_96_part_00